MTRWRELGLLAGALVFSLLLAEGALRLHYALSPPATLADLPPAPPAPAPGRSVNLGEIIQVSSDPRLVYQMLPGLDARFRDAALRTNAQGWREEEIPRAKEPSTVRLVGLGDSVMFGWGVEVWERYMDRLERRLGEAHPERRWQAVTLAAPGYNLVMEVEAFERFGLDYSPDLVIVGFSINDFCLPNFVTPRRSPWDRESFLELYLRRGGAALPRLVDRIEVLRRPEAGRGALEAPGATRFFDTFCSPENVPRQYRHLVGGESFLRALARLVAIGRERRVPVVFMHHGIGEGFVPLGGRAGEEATPAERVLDQVLALDGLLVADLTGDFREVLRRGLPGSELVLSPSDPHPSSRGHALIARFLARALETEGVIRRLAATEAEPITSP